MKLIFLDYLIYLFIMSPLIILFIKNKFRPIFSKFSSTDSRAYITNCCPFYFCFHIKRWRIIITIIDKK